MKLQSFGLVGLSAKYFGPIEPILSTLVLFQNLASSEYSFLQPIRLLAGIHPATSYYVVIMWSQNCHHFVSNLSQTYLKVV